MSQTSVLEKKVNLNIETLSRDTIIVLTLQVVGMALSYLMQVFLAQWMGKNEYGIYEYVMSWTLLLAIVAEFGWPHTVLRFILEYRVKQQWEYLQGIVRISWLLTVLAGVVLSLAAIGIVLLLDHYRSFTYTTPMLVGIGLGLVPLLALSGVQLEMARAVDDLTLAFAPYRVIWPSLVLAGGFFLWQTNHSLTSIPMISAASLALLFVIVFQLWVLWKQFNKEFEPASPVYAIREWIGVALPLFLQGAFSIILSQTDIVMVGSILGPEDAAIYSAAIRTSTWTIFMLPTMNMVAAPMYASFYAQKDRQGLQQLVSVVALRIFWPSLAIAFILIVFAQPALGIFGSEFIVADWELKILVLGQLVNVLSGPVYFLTAMTGHQNKSVVAFGWATLMHLVLNAIAIPVFGTIGAAMATTFTMVVLNIWLNILVIKNIEINPSIFSGLFSLRNQPELEAVKNGSVATPEDGSQP